MQVAELKPLSFCIRWTHFGSYSSFSEVLYDSSAPPTAISFIPSAPCMATDLSRPIWSKEWDIWRTQLACARGSGGMSPWEIFEILVQNGAKWCNLTHFEDIYPRLYLHRQLVILTLEQIGARSAKLLIEFTARQSNACDSQTAAWERDTTDECVSLTLNVWDL